MKLAAWLAVCPWLACACELPREPASCHYGRDHQVGVAHGLEIDALALAHWRSGALALWSDAGGLHAAILTDDGRPRGPAARLGARCAGGLASASSADGQVWLACLRPTRRIPGKPNVPGQVTLYAVQGERAQKAEDRRVVAPAATPRLRFGVAGSRSRGVALAVHEGEAAVVWQDAAAQHERVWWLRTALPVTAAGAPGARPVPRVLSRSGTTAGAPSALWDARGLHLIWSEQSLAGDVLQHRIMAAGPEGVPRVVLSTAQAPSSARLLRTRAGLLFALRAQPGKGYRTGLYVAPLDPRLKPLHPPERVARADGEGHPVLASGGTGPLIAYPRTFGSDAFVAANQLTPEGRRLQPEQQFYQDQARFTQVAALGLAKHGLLLIGERGASTRPEANLLAVTFRCAP